jgi:hypothetical protein
MPSKEPVPKKSESTIVTLIADIEEIKLKRQPSIETYLSLEHYFGSISEALQIVRKYSADTSVSFDYNTMQQDLTVLSAIHASTAEMVGYLQGTAARAEDTRKIVKSDYSMKIKELRDDAIKRGDIVKLTESDVDNASRMKSKEAYMAARDQEIVSRMMSSAWYAIGDFTKVLNSSLNRALRELDNDRTRKS